MLKGAGGCWRVPEGTRWYHSYEFPYNFQFTKNLMKETALSQTKLNLFVIKDLVFLYEYSFFRAKESFLLFEELL